MRTIYIAFALIAAFLSDGCAFFPKEVNLAMPGRATEPGDALSGLTVRVVVEDARAGDPAVVGSGGPLSASVTTTDSVPQWVEKCITGELTAAGCAVGADADIIMRVKVKDAFATLWPFVISGVMRMEVEVVNVEKTVFSEVLEGSSSPFVLVGTKGCYEGALESALYDWNETNMPEIVAALADVAGRKPGQSVVLTPIVDEEPEPPVESGSEGGTAPKPPPLPVITIIEPKNGAVIRTKETPVKFKIENANSLELFVISVNLTEFHRRLNEGFKDDLEAEHTVALQNGNNSVAVVGITKDGANMSAIVNVAYTPYAPADRKILSIGISRFGNIAGDFTGENAAAEFDKVLRDNLPDEAKTALKLVAGNDADFQSVMKELKKTLAAASENESCVIFYSGKVLGDGKEIALAAEDTDPQKPATAVSISDLTLQLAGDFKGRGVLLIIEFVLSLDDEKIIAAAIESEKRLSVLALSDASQIGELLGGKADADGDGHVSVREIKESLEKSEGAAKFFGEIPAETIIR
jgi:uncharacterized lipoprotein YajG